MDDDIYGIPIRLKFCGVDVNHGTHVFKDTGGNLFLCRGWDASWN